MKNEEYVLPGQLEIPVDKVDRLLDAGDGDACLLYLYILRNEGNLSLETAGEELGLGDRADAAAEKLRELGLIGSPGTRWRGKNVHAARRSAPQPPEPVVLPERKAEPAPPARAEAPPEKPLRQPDRLPEYSGKELSKMGQNQDFAGMLEEVQRQLGTILTQSGLEAFAGFYDYLGLPPDVITMLVGYCVQHLGRQGADGQPRNPGLQVIKREAYHWAELNLRDLEAAGEYVRRMEGAKSLKGRYRAIMGLTERAPSQTEERCLGEWSAAGYPEELIAEAYDRTTQKTGRLVWKYMDAILKNWEAKGLRSLEAVRAGDTPPARSPQHEGGEEAPGEYDRMKKYLDKLKDS